ncbi:uncharacterized protein [Cicer arietinum]|uniref:Uncharacterized protein LOC101503220 n=1 Tax=Cicer arietinum TaxID=3827 RepID=A0A1S2YEI1_CICAR|nr:uncharacterized protein LOC101503220 [Cicer arietinum]
MEEKHYSKAKWDCGSTLYDSYELNSFKHQLNSAIANSPRTLSMPHLPQRSSTLHHEPTSSHLNNNNPSTFKISRTFQKLLRFLFKSAGSIKSNKVSSSSCRSNSFRSAAEKYPKEDHRRLCVVYDKYESEPVVLSTIPESEFEIAGLSPDISAFVRKSVSERFTATATIGISCL